MSENINLSVIVAVFNRHDELQELLNSLLVQSDTDFEIVVVDDGSKYKLDSVVNEYESRLNIKYFYKDNSGPGLTRNYGTKQASGNYFIFLDSDCIVPKEYISNIKTELENNYVDAFGGADSADKSFNNLQKAISYSMTSFFTTGGIRGSKKSVGKFQPRSFNMGISREAFETVGGFSEMRIGEDPDLSMTLWEKGFDTRFFPDCKVFHKRRASLSSFAKQVNQFGIARPILNQRHPKYTKITFWFPTVFMLCAVFSLLVFYLSFLFENKIFSVIFKLPFYFLCLYIFMLFVDSSLKNKSLKVGLLSLVTTFVQFFSYGFGFLKSFVLLNFFKQNPKKVFPSHFYK